MYISVKMACVTFFFSAVCFPASFGLLSDKLFFGVGLYSVYKGKDITLKKKSCVLGFI